MLSIVRASGIVVVSLLMVVPACANSADRFTFGGLSNNEQPLNYFLGAYGSAGSGPGPNYDITFSPNAFIVSGANGNLLMGNGTMVMNVHTEFANSFKLGYVTLAPEVVNVWSDYNGTGYLLATMTLMPNKSCHSVTKCSWRGAKEPFSGTAASVTFSGAGVQFGTGSMTLGAPYYGRKSTGVMAAAGAMATPEPSSLVLLPTGLAGLMWICMRRKRAAPGFALNCRTYLSQ